ncbi:MAG TPA: SDR family oxidoreductase [Thermoflexales bacterium]|nr:SDR family oxidoreductase [Thermoflexales bacterium]HRA55123.1 SDR family oxidoreductase [Thermoflexales bacterium]
MAQDFNGKVVVITGGASGMGAATAGLFAESGARVFIIDRNADLAQTMASALSVEAIVGDVSQSAFCESAIARAAAGGRIDVLVNAAGIIIRANGLDTSDEDWQRTLNVNVSGVFYMCRAAIRQMKTQAPNADGARGAIVNFGSIWGELSGKGALAYAASKGAVHQITRTFAIEHARDGIRVNAVCPGEVDTPMLRTAGRTVPLTDAQAAEMGERVVPMGRLAQPVEIARMVRFLCSPEASYITGAMHYVDAGYSAV